MFFVSTCRHGDCRHLGFCRRDQYELAPIDDSAGFLTIFLGSIRAEDIET